VTFSSFGISSTFLACLPRPFLAATGFSTSSVLFVDDIVTISAVSGSFS
jgi:hypothetical protein